MDKISVNNAPFIPNQVDIINKYLESPKPKASFLIMSEIIKFKISNNMRNIIDKNRYL